MDTKDKHITPPYYGPLHREFIEHYGLSRGWYLGNAVKYIIRAGKKEGEPEERDIAKAIKNLEFYLQEMKKRESDG